MSNTSATGGYLVPGLIQPDEDQLLNRFIQRLLLGLLGLSGDLVRPMWSLNPAPIPNVTVDWVAFGIASQIPDANAYQEQTSETGMLLIRHETLEVDCVFYGPHCQKNANLVVDGLQIAQNREGLLLAGMGVVGTSDVIHVPEIVNDRFFDRVDLTITLRREVRRDYPILTFLGVYGTVEANKEESTLSNNWQTPL